MERSAQLPAYLCAYPKLQQWQKLQETQRYASWVLDSGAFSVSRAGQVIDLGEFMRASQLLRQAPSPPSLIFSLDVIGDAEATLRNTQEMWQRGIEAIPCFHYGESPEVLQHLAREYPYIAIGGVASLTNREKLRFAEKCFSRVWPHRIHGFSYCSPLFVRELPFTSVDSTSWYMQTMVYHRCRGLDGLHARGLRASSLRADIEYYLDLQEEVRFRWQKEMQRVDAKGPTLYLALGNEMLSRSIPTGYERVSV